MRPSFLTALTFALAACASTPREAEPIFRSISIQPFPSITLGERFEPIPLATRLDDSTWALRPRSFGEAETIRVHVRPDGRVYGLSFTYGPAESYARKVASYTESLGPAFSRSSPEADSAWTVWRDARTRFELARVHGQPERLRARMSDLGPGSR
jgi:hypothetical protein